MCIRDRYQRRVRESGQRSMSSAPLSLFRRILRLHRFKLPADMRHLGDSYVKEEFRLHRTAPPQQVSVFMSEWKQYAAQLEEQVTDFGKELSDVEMEGLTLEQQQQLGKLRGQSGQDS
eukprot:TRINITY_DN644_c0_g1_i1.p2 TRINITY_DN644_c0_g1~~TRINITY_DN644_c0_g1_i1.p2  ORF type:complete len:118 (+),score=42.12 TRINITY_DN644_c0_g1_i1:180-533(+)